MRISISKKHSDALGESTQVKIVIPTTSSKSNLKPKQGPSLSRSSSSIIQEEEKFNTQSKRTARKTMSSFTPRKQISNLSKPYDFSVVTIDSDGENDGENHEKSPKKKIKLSEAEIPSINVTTKQC